MSRGCARREGVTISGVRGFDEMPRLNHDAGRRRFGLLCYVLVLDDNVVNAKSLERGEGSCWRRWRVSQQHQESVWICMVFRRVDELGESNADGSKQAIARLRCYSPPMSAYSSIPYTRRAAVLIILFSDRKGELRVVLTVRANTLKSYPGQAALPGGKADSPLETPLETARREAQEEIGLPSNDAKLPPPFRLEHLCQLPTNLAKTELAVCPCVAFIHSGDDNAWNDADVETNLIPTLDAREVAVVFTAPFHNFLMVEDEVNTEEAHTTNSNKSRWYTGSWTDWHESPWRMHNFHVPVVGQSVRRAKEISADESQETAAEQLEKSGEVGALRRYRVFGMTARILVDAARVAYGQEPEFEHNSHFGDEDMIRRLQKMGRFTEKRTIEDDLRKEDLVKAAKI